MKKRILFTLFCMTLSFVARSDEDGDGDGGNVGPPSASPTTLPSASSSSTTVGVPSVSMPSRETFVPRFLPREEDLDTEYDGSVYSEKCGAAQSFRQKRNAWAIRETTKELKKLKKYARAAEPRPTGKWELDHANIYDAFDPAGGDEALMRAFYQFRHTSAVFLNRLAVGGDLDRELKACTVRSSGVAGRGTALYNSILYSKKFLISRIVLSKYLSDQNLKMARTDVQKCLGGYWEEASESILVGPHGLDKRVAFPTQCPRERFLRLREDLRQVFRDLIEPFSGDQFSSESATASVH